MTATNAACTDTPTRLQRELTIYDRLLRGERLTVRQVAVLTGMSWDGARKLMVRLAMARPVTDDEGRWYLLRE